MSVTIARRKVGHIGYGLMGLTWRPQVTPDDQAFAAMRAALDNGCNLWNGGVFYGTPENNSLTLLNRFYSKYPEDADKVVLILKGALRNMQPDSSPDFIRAEIGTSLKQLGGKGRIDIYECSRRDPRTPLKDMLLCLDGLVKEGKIGSIGLSEVNANTIREAAAITKISAVEIELSLWQTEPLTNGITEACAELDIPIIAYSPIGRGFLTGQIQSPSDLPEGDIRRLFPRFQPENFLINIQLVNKLKQFAQQKNCTPAQLALGWLIGLSKQPGMPTIVPIPGTTTRERVEENAAAVELGEGEMRELGVLVEECEVRGERYNAEGMKMVNG